MSCEHLLPWLLANKDELIRSLMDGSYRPNLFLPVVRFFMADFELNYELFVFLSKRLQLVTFFFIFAVILIKIGGSYEEAVSTFFWNHQFWCFLY